MKQQGIYYQNDDPGQSLSMIFLNVTQEFTNVSEVGHQINELWKIYEDLRNGQIKDEMISGKPTSETFTFLIGYGRSMFNSIKKESLVPNMFRITDDLPDFNEPKINLSTRIWEGSGLFYSNGVTTNRANAAIVIQFISDAESDTKRAVLETWKYLLKNDNPPLLKLSGYYNGFQRTDERNMLDFLDGISNLDPTEREGIIFNAEAPTIGLTNRLPPDLSMIETHKKMLKDSTYMCFLRILIDFLAWRSIDGKEQSKIVGRDKVTGCPLDSQSPDKSVVGCPVAHTHSILDRGNSQFLDYKKFLEKSHISRVRKFDNNQTRIFRQGYNFFDSTNDDPYIKVGLNFVSFQNDLSRLHTILTNAQWMGDVTFGGTGNELADMFKIESAGMFFVPPMNDKFPGSEIFEPDNHQ